MHREWIGVELGDVEPIINRLDGTGNDVALPDLGDGGRKRAKSLKPRPLDESAPVLSLW